MTHDRIAARLRAAGYDATATIAEAAWITVRVGDVAFVVGDNTDTWGADYYPSREALAAGEPMEGFATTIPNTSDDDAAIATAVVSRIAAFLAFAGYPYLTTQNQNQNQNQEQPHESSKDDRPRHL